jgi:hypothetical protein
VVTDEAFAVPAVADLQPTRSGVQLAGVSTAIFHGFHPWLFTFGIFGAGL